MGPLQGQGTATQSKAAPQRSTVTAPDTISRRADSLYISILEKTNNQLSLWWNPWGVFIAALGILFGIAAIVVGVLLFRQSREYRQLIQDSIGKYETIVQTLIQDRLDQMQVQVDKLLTESKEQLKTATADQRKKIEQKIASLEKRREEIQQTELPKISFIPGSGILGSTGYSSTLSPIESAFLSSGSTIKLSSLGSGIHFMNRRTCTNCHKEFDVPAGAAGGIYVGGRDVSCPHCGAKNHVDY